MSDQALPETNPQPAGEGIRELQARLYREIGVLAVARALDLDEAPPGRYELVSRLRDAAQGLTHYAPVVKPGQAA